jgi:hypothetical protein
LPLCSFKSADLQRQGKADFLKMPLCTGAEYPLFTRAKYDTW